jgi:hypothetical protein
MGFPTPSSQDCNSSATDKKSDSFFPLIEDSQMTATRYPEEIRVRNFRNQKRFRNTRVDRHLSLL